MSRSALLQASLLAAALVLAPAPAAAQVGAGTSDARFPVGFERPGWTSQRPSPFLTVRTRRVAGFLTIAPALSMFVLYLFRPKPYVLAWVAAWLAASATVLMLSFDAQDLRLDLADEGRQARLVWGRVAIAGWALLGIVFAALLRFGAVWFRRPTPIPRAAWAVLLALAAWFAVSAIWFGLIGIVLPMFLLMVGLEVRAAYECFRIARRYRFASALVLGLCIAAMAAGLVVAGFHMAVNEGPTPLGATLAYMNAVWALGIAFGMHLLVFEDVTSELRDANVELAGARDELQALATTDPLTGCYNRRFFAQVVRHELEQHGRYAVPLSLLFVDVDRFKAVNDTAGHDTGDRLLAAIGALLRERTRQSDLVFRWGGDEFLVMLSADEAAARTKADELRDAFRLLPIAGEVPEAVGLSIGCVPVPQGATDLAPFVERADHDMYVRKRALSSLRA